jgi:hypothetical protein
MGSKSRDSPRASDPAPYTQHAQSEKKKGGKESEKEMSEDRHKVAPQRKVKYKKSRKETIEKEKKNEKKETQNSTERSGKSK